MEFHFHIEEIDDGWMDVSVSDGERKILIANSDYMGNDAPALLLKALTKLAKKQDGTAYLCWNDEPGGYHWTLEKKADRLSYQIGVMENPDKDYRTFEGSALKDSALADILLKGEVGLKDFAEEILREMTDYSEGEKLDIYESEWSDFPTEEISNLRRSLITL